MSEVFEESNLGAIDVAMISIERAIRLLRRAEPLLSSGVVRDEITAFLEGLK